MRRWVMGLMVVVFGIAAAASEDRGENTRQVLQKLAKASVYIKTERVFKYEHFPASGSGFFVHPDGYVLTNWHVVADQVEGYLWGEDREINAKVLDLVVVVDSGESREREVPAKIVARDRQRDLALLKVAYRPTAFIDLNTVRDVTLGDTVWVGGFPFGDLLSKERKSVTVQRVNPAVTVTSGTVTSLRRDRNGHVAMVQTDAAVNPGNSGGPMIDTDGNLVGVVFAGIRAGEGLGFGVSPYRIREFIRKQAIKIQFRPGTVLSPPQPITVTVDPILADLDPDRGEFRLDGDDIPSATAVLGRSGPGLTATIDFPERLEGVPRPKRYTATVTLYAQDSPRPMVRRYHLDAVPESMTTLNSARDPGQMLEDRKLLGHEMAIEDFTKDARVSGGRERRSLADAGESVRLKRTKKGSIILDNRAVDELAGGDGGRERYRFLKDPDLERLAREFDAMTRQVAAIEQARFVSQAEFQRRLDLRQRLSDLGKQLRQRNVVWCNDPPFYFIRDRRGEANHGCKSWVKPY